MTKTIAFLAFCAAGILLVTACAPATPEPNDFPSPPPTILPTQAPAATAEVSTSLTAVPTNQPAPQSTPIELVPGTVPGGQKIVTRDDQGKTININTGDSFLLQLGENYNWDISISDPAVLSRIVNIAVIKGAQGVYSAHQPGTVTLTAVGDPLCRQSQPPCMMPSIQFKVTIVVK